MGPQPNVLFILSDQHNAKVLGHAGHPVVRTPHLDRLAADGVRFERAITQNPICTPSRLSWHSGQYCHNHGYYGLCGPEPRPALPGVMGHFRRFGWRTLAAGKIHLPAHWLEDQCDEFLECNETCSVGGAPEYRAYLTRKGLWEKRDVQDAPWVQELPPAEWGKYANPRRANIDGRPSALAYEDTEEGWVAQRCIDFMGRCRKAGEPFFVHASLPRPHSPYVPPQCFWDLYPDDSIALPPNADYDMALKAPHLRRMARTWRENKHWITEQPDDFESARRRKLRGYLGCVSLVDHAVGQLVDWIDDHGLAENTIIVYSTDHGDYACEHGQLEKAPGICSDAITRIPMIWRWPGRVKAGLDSPAIAETVDLSQTLCALAGLDRLETSDGRDLSAILAGGSQPVREVGVTEFAWSKSIRKGQWRLVWYPREKFAGEYPDGFGELYDLDADPWEMTNRWFDPDCQAKVRELERDLMDWLVTTTRPATVLPWQRFGGWQAERRYKNCVLADGKIHFDRVRAIKEGNYI